MIGELFDRLMERVWDWADERYKQLEDMSLCEAFLYLCALILLHPLFLLEGIVLSVRRRRILAKYRK